MKEKYIEERWPRLFSIDTKNPGVKFVCTEDERIDQALGPEAAEQLIAQWNRMQDALTRLALEFDRVNPQAFQDFWYGPEIGK
jgi:hypothetical protein